MPSSTVPIPVPSDGTDAPHSAISTITALRCVAESFDAVMGSLQESIDRESERLDQLSERSERCRDTLRRQRATDTHNGAEGKPLVVRLPREYQRAVSGVRVAPTAAVEEEEEAVAASTGYKSAIAAARDASNEAVRRVLRRDYELDDGEARMSDLWLDRPRAFDVGAACRSALRSHAVPSLGHQRPQPDGMQYYKGALEGGGGGSQSGAMGRSASSTMGGLAASGGSSASPSEWDGAASVRTGVSLSTRATNAAAGATASDRRRQRQLQSLARKKSAGTTGSGAGGAGGEDQGGGASINRQEALTGSRPYLCEILHDAYGAGDGGAGTIFPAPRAVSELRIFNSGQPAYGKSYSVTASQGAKMESERKHLPAKDSTQLASPETTPRMKGAASSNMVR